MSAFSWFLLALLVAINFFRIAVIDPSAKGPDCVNIPQSFYNHVSDANVTAESVVSVSSLTSVAVRGSIRGGIRILTQRMLSESANANVNESSIACDTYVLIYAYTIAAFLSIAGLIVYASSTIYLDRIILKSLTVDKIESKGRFAYEDSLVIMIRKDKMVAHDGMDRLISDKLSQKPSRNPSSAPGDNHSVNPTSHSGNIETIIQDTKRHQLFESHKNNLSHSTLFGFMKHSLSIIEHKVSRAGSFASGGSGLSVERNNEPGEPVGDPRPEGYNADEDLSSIFLFNWPGLFFKSVEAILLFQCFYISMVCTQLIPLSLHSLHSAGWVIGFLIPMGFNFFIIQMVLNKAVLLRSVYQLEREIAGKICEDAVEERGAIANLRSTMAIKLLEEEIPREEWVTFLQRYFFRYDKKKTGIVNKSDFRRILGDLRIYMSRDSFGLLWQAVDYDLSGGLDAIEIEELFFPRAKSIVKKRSGHDMPAIKELRAALQKMLADENILMFNWEDYLHDAFNKYDTDKSGLVDITEFSNMLQSLNVIVPTNILSDVFNFFDVKKTGTMSYEDFFDIFFPSSTV